MAATNYGETRTVDIDGAINYVDFGGEGRSLVLVHGLGGSIQNWLAVGPQLAESYRVRAVDLRGFGRSPLPEGGSAKVQDNQKVLDRFLTEVVEDEASILVGNSMGGMISILQTAARPDSVAALVLVDPAVPYPDGVEPDPMVAVTFATYMMDNAEELVNAYTSQMTPEQMVMTTMQLCCVDVGRIPEEVLAAHIELATERSQESGTNKAHIEAARSLLELHAEPESYYAAIDGVEVPTLFVQGAEDRLVPLDAAEEIAKRRPDWTFEVLEGIGHVPQLEAPDRFVEIVTGWLDRLNLGSESLATPTI